MEEKKDLKRIGKNIVGVIDIKSFGGYLKPDSQNIAYKIYIPKKNLHKALDGDKVQVVILSKISDKGNEYEANIVRIVKRKTLRFSGIFEKMKNGKTGFVRPYSKKMPVDIYVPEKNCEGVEDGDVVIVKIIGWKEDARSPMGIVVKNFGKTGEHNAEISAIMFNNEIEETFPDFVIRESEEIQFEISEEEVKNRRDFRGITTFTIDGVDAKDFDDALSFQALDNNEYEIGVHIADVTHYVQEGTSLDKEAYERTTSVYLVDRVIPMLPERLSNGVCSLRPGEDKLCFSAIFRVRDNVGSFEIIDTKFQKTIIHSQNRLTYDEAQDIIENEINDIKVKRPELYNSGIAIQILDIIAKDFRKQRFEVGAVSFGKRELKFSLDKDKKPIDVYFKTQKDANMLIEEFMLLANRKVSEFVANLNKPYIYRTHDIPNPDRMKELSVLAKEFGYDFTIYSDQKKTKKSLNKLLTQVIGSGEENMLQTLAVRAMSKAIYSSAATGHYGLAFEYYSHFTSPIRRYSDIISHRLLWKYLNSNGKVNEKMLEKKCEHCSITENKAAKAERESIKFKQIEFLKDKVGQSYSATITDINDNGVFAEIIENGCDGFIQKNTLEEFGIILDKKKFSLTLSSNEVKRLGDLIEVEIKKVSINKKQIEFIIKN